MIRIRSRHPSPVELSRALNEGPDTALAAHLRECDACAIAWSEWQRTDELARRLPAAEPSEIRMDAVLRAVREATTEPRASAGHDRTPWLRFSLAGASVAAIALFVVGGGSLFSAEVQPRQQVQELVYRGEVRVLEGTRMVRESSAPDEVVRLFEGTIFVDVAALSKGERFRVIVGDGEVEVRGTAFEVTARRDALAVVLVEHGVVEVRPEGREVAVLRDGQRWEAQGSEAPALPIPSPQPRPSSRSRSQALPQQEGGATSPDAPPPRAPEPKEKAPVQAPSLRDHPMASLFDRGWKQLREGRVEEAIRSFDEALAKYASDPLAEDASFWRAVALVRSRRAEAASRALHAFLESYPTSLRAGEASAMLGWILLGEGDLQGAEVRFRSAAADPVESVRASGEKGLATVRATRESRGDVR